jgi:hypothetical protein
MITFITGFVIGASGATLVVGLLRDRADRKKAERAAFELALKIARTQRRSVARPGTGAARIKQATIRADSPSMRSGGTTEIP